MPGAPPRFSLVYVYLGEIFPSSCRCSAMALCFSGGRFGAIVAPVLFELLEFERAGPATHMRSHWRPHTLLDRESYHVAFQGPSRGDIRTSTHVAKWVRD